MPLGKTGWLIAGCYLAVTWLMLAVPAQKLAVMLADSWLLSDNSQPGCKRLKLIRNSRPEIHHNSQQKNSFEITARNSQRIAVCAGRTGPRGGRRARAAVAALPGLRAYRRHGS
ncbi:hypothetical protein [Sphingomonas oligophenolica]|uniref:hypothetical protein n=1 Tax=Sphingomonas oligophenolica TaxID=301154 RepID=UPI0031CE992E